MDDFGLRQDLGTPFFAGSGLLRSLATAGDLDSLEQGATADPEWLHWVGYHRDFSPANLLEAIGQLGQTPVPRQMRLSQPGYLVNATDLSINQLRRGAETAIRRGDFKEAVRLLEIAQLQRPEHRNISRRLAAVRHDNRWKLRLALLVSPGFRL